MFSVTKSIRLIANNYSSCKFERFQSEIGAVGPGFLSDLLFVWLGFGPGAYV